MCISSKMNFLNRSTNQNDANNFSENNGEMITENRYHDCLTNNHNCCNRFSDNSGDETFTCEGVKKSFTDRQIVSKENLSSSHNSLQNFNSFVSFDNISSFNISSFGQVPEVLIETSYFNKKYFNPVARFVAQVACIALRGSVSAQANLTLYSKPLQYSCQVCCNSFLYKFAQAILRQEKSNSSVDTSVLPSKDFISSLYNNSYEQDMESTIVKVFEVLNSVFHIRTTEVVQAVALFDRILKQHWRCFVFTYLFKTSLKTLFLACILVAHKQSTDCCYRNSSFTKEFGLSLQTINSFEKAVLDLVSWDTCVKKDVYNCFHHALIDIIDKNNCFSNSSVESGCFSKEEDESCDETSSCSSSSSSSSCSSSVCNSNASQNVQNIDCLNDGSMEIEVT